MKNKMLKGIALAFITAVVIACQPKKEEETAAAPAVDKEAIKAELQTMESAFADALNNGKTDGIVYYADDATSYEQNKPPTVGKAAIDKSIKDEGGMKNGSKISFTANEVHPSSDGNQVVELGSYKVVDSTGTSKATGNYMAMFEKRDGKYVCVRDMGASDMPKKEEKK
jgi:ketosteroid isomerase-like protein